MKLSNTKLSREERIQNSNDHSYVMEGGVASIETFPPSLVAHLSTKLDESISFLTNRLDDVTCTEIRESLSNIVGRELLKNLIRKENIFNNSKLSQLGNKLVRAVRVLPLELVRNQLLNYNTIQSLSDILSYYDDYLQKNKEIFTTITQHHQKVKQVDDWSVVASDTSALKSYSIMAHAMGDKAWVLEANWWMAKYIQQFFFGDISAKFARKYFTPALCREDADKHSLIQQYVAHIRSCIDPEPSLSATSSSHGKVRVLDVGSCYNPLARSPDAEYMDITAVDLHPSNVPMGDESIADEYHVHTCDFLTVPVSSDVDSKIVITLNDENSKKETYVQSIPRNFYHAVTMSLVLSYLPDPASRAIMVTKAFHTLQAVHGLFLIVEKDSIFKNINHPSIKYDPRGSWPIWKRAMWRLGFACVKYEHHRHSPLNSSISSASVATSVRMSHIMVFVTRNQLPDPAPFTEEPYHVKTPVQATSSIDIPQVSSTGAFSTEELEQLWIKQDLEAPEPLQK